MIATCRKCTPFPIVHFFHHPRKRPNFCHSLLRLARNEDISMASRLVVKRQVLGLYAQCLRSARKCPQWEQREMMKAYVKMKFRHDADVQDPARIQSLLADARDELEQMEYYHSVYEAKERAKAAAREASTTRTIAPSSASSTATKTEVCPHCSTAYQPATAKFCSNCGEKRVSAA